MSYLNRIFEPSPAAKPSRPNILGVTGLSRPEVKALYRRDGLFGKVSKLTSDQQAVVQAWLGPIPGVAARPAPSWMTPQLRALAAYTGVLVAGIDTEADRVKIERTGFHDSAISEVERVVENVRVVFRVPATAGAARTTVASFSRAA